MLKTFLLFLENTDRLNESYKCLTVRALAASCMFWEMWSYLCNDTPCPILMSSSVRLNNLAVFSLNASLHWPLNGIGRTSG